MMAVADDAEIQDTRDRVVLVHCMVVDHNGLAHRFPDPNIVEHPELSFARRQRLPPLKLRQHLEG